ncbi:NUDIX hydrolase [Streptomyces sp. NPDC088354]|uniref:nucleotide triphosphate diphosphatase NUDT15 n=1 Tax=unclassified Streptomyces TaxID=2593676 RepID=UPI0029B66312|nr:NUDIX domain-containing protein [Streptomyces sp. MI02-7b]MDX3073610.1 NUDIX domain-containing protein [Streptomyces sp. MI02-7b]
MSGIAEPTVRVGVQTILRREGAILLGLRVNTFGHGTWGLPGGHVELGETLLEAAARELKEETGVAALEMRVAHVTDPDPVANHHMQIGVEVLSFSGEPVVREAHRCGRWEFWPLDALPEALFVGSAGVLRAARRGLFHVP